jgi:hypothetical protein
MKFLLYFIPLLFMSATKNGIQDANIPIVPATKMKDAKAFCKQKGMNEEMALFIDMSIHSGKKRIFLVDLKTDKILLSGLCSHGCCDNAWGQDDSKENPRFNNIPESHCSSLGKFKIGKRGYSNWGIHINYKLHGLEASNSMAYSRFIVLHSWNAVTDHEIFPEGTAEGWGCPAVSNVFLKSLVPKLDAATKPVLLWIYER